MPLTKIYRGSEECLKSETLSLPKTSVDHPNPTYTMFSLSTTNIPERDSTEAEAGVNGGVLVAQPSEENPVILRLKKILSIKSDQTVIEVSPMLI
jgi:hypothetical protein